MAGLSSGVRDPIDEALVVVGNVERPVATRRQTGGPAEDDAVLQKTGGEVFDPTCSAVLHHHTPDAIAVCLSGRTVKGDEEGVSIRGGKRRSAVEPHVD